uniref:Transmembrane protein 65 n=1 Tax=Chelonoidis abingdonii TaxID=106734 RepID=A0A8C0GLR3_CHEAB
HEQRVRLPSLGHQRRKEPSPAAAARFPAPRLCPGWCPGLRLPAASGLAPPGRPRALGTHPKKEPIEALNTAQGARDFIYSLHSTERSCLLRELHRFESIAIAQGERPAPRALPCPLRVFFHNAIPFVGFGFLDNAIMIAAVSFLSSNMWLFFSLAGYVEALASRMGLSIPDLTPKQADMWQTRLSAHVVNIFMYKSIFLKFFDKDQIFNEEKKLEEKN